ncbi:MAG: hypothetical protein AVDCRST_MAG52-391, partial [uncultured Blastococcus sp.]
DHTRDRYGPGDPPRCRDPGGRRAAAPGVPALVAGPDRGRLGRAHRARPPGPLDRRLRRRAGSRRRGQVHHDPRGGRARRRAHDDRRVRPAPAAGGRVGAAGGRGLAGRPGPVERGRPDPPELRPALPGRGRRGRLRDGLALVPGQARGRARRWPGTGQLGHVLRRGRAVLRSPALL